MSVRELKTALGLPWAAFVHDSAREVRVQVMATGRADAAPPSASEAETRRQARSAAIANARLDADAYARAMGLRTIRLSGLSETGEGVVARIQRALRPAQAEPDRARAPVEARVVAEFVLAP